MADQNVDHASLILDSNAPNSVFRWESASGLEHTCYACTMKMNNPKARQQCYGIHSIPCIRYHQTMHAIGTSHNCFACLTADTLHENRHRKIAELLAEYNAADDEAPSGESSKKRTGLHERDANTPVRQAERIIHRMANDHDGIENEDIDNHNENQNALTPEPSDDTELSSVSTASEAASTYMSKSEQRAFKKAAREQKAVLKAAKNSSKHNVTVKAEDVAKVGHILHGDQEDQKSGSGHPLANDKSIEEVMRRNMAFVSNIQSHKTYLLKTVAGRRKSDKEKKRAANPDKKKSMKRMSDHNQKYHNPSQPSPNKGTEHLFYDDQMDQIINAILLKFGISGASTPAANAPNSTPQTPSVRKTRSTSLTSGTATMSNHGLKQVILDKLREAIRDDLAKYENEQRQTYIRAGGFWRYVGKSVFDRMTEIAQKIDWKTGEIFDR